MKRAIRIIIAISLIGIVWISCNQPNEEQVNHDLPLLSIIDSLGLNKNDVWIHVDKSNYQLSILIDSQVIKTYPIVLGFNPVDDKMKEGDGCTPEGVFELIDLYPHAKWSKFMWIGYPNDESWKKFEANKASGLISESDGIGGEVGIHGVPEGMDALIDVGKNWTLGCISLKNKDVDEIYAVSQKGTKVVIVH